MKPELGLTPEALDETKLNRLKIRILSLERDNLKTREFGYDDMVNRIRKLIEEEVKKCY
ncbi:MAG: hypothetical protein ACOYEQ_02275 [Bacillota bacterium]